MLRGKTWFKCECCGHVFKSWDIEDNATVYSMPMTCPECGGKGHAIGNCYNMFDRLIDKIINSLGCKPRHRLNHTSLTK